MYKSKELGNPFAVLKAAGPIKYEIDRVPTAFFWYP